VNGGSVEAGGAEDAQTAGGEKEPDEVLLAALQVKEASHSSRRAGDIDEERSTRAIFWSGRKAGAKRSWPWWGRFSLPFFSAGFSSITCECLMGYNGGAHA